MPFNYENFINNSKLEYTKEITGIDEFLSAIDFHYFSSVKLNNKHITFNSISLVLEVSCNLNLLELLAHFNTGRWGNSGKEDSPLHIALENLDLKNQCNIDIEELTFFLNDTSIVIKRIYNRSISTQVNDIFKQIAFNYVFLTRGLTQKPYEIFVPIFEDYIENIEADDEQLNMAPKSYSEFWGIYLDKDDEASIYDVNKNTYVSGDLEFLSE
ncbi:hypothetical protein DFQ03_1898 [Maribacter caenipelagi]|uniref:Uncharacterized protein n=1 Tax=Maribacter caenipelagi TaxID=1447781 RepID=A0A4R7D451_9FLAO|nr:hypothetical protein [Maribacter caenipelagi]TDS15257.1 hypothetical protein DFQ03_1898 [Maribacter caenipelagi]|tara:strand:+ start:195 stop:833 length:639 start_codon:yes stop_codon:yes gene_type:complete